jgi:hypothetical protein
VKIGDLVYWWPRPSEMGVIIKILTYEEKNYDPFPWFQVLIQDGSTKKYRESDLIEVG